MSADKSRAARLAKELHPTMPVGSLRMWADEAAAELRRQDEAIAELVEALAFYADDSRYNGPNQRLTDPDQWSAQAGETAYRLDVTKDRGRIAAAAIAKHKEASE